MNSANDAFERLPDGKRHFAVGEIDGGSVASRPTRPAFPADRVLSPSSWLVPIRDFRE